VNKPARPMSEQDWRETVKGLRRQLADAQDRIAHLELSHRELVGALEVTRIGERIVAGLQGRVLHLLRKRAGNPISREAMMHALYADRIGGEWPDERILDTTVSRLRQRLRDGGTGETIETVNRLGWRLVSGMKEDMK
jgi:DNA-binding winged helix-turn-helix (wHTH) protein